MKRKIIIAMLFATLFMYIIVRPLRTDNDLMSIAKNEIEEYLKIDEDWTDSQIKELNGPIIIDGINGKSKFRKFTWYKLKSANDTAKINVTVFKNITSPSWRDDFFWPKLTKNDKW